ncbi:MAG: FG-GAP repeat protein [Deltaproteobacteria bacterium]|nr:FG-GAP repeat protein [Deltaproteobacteria bacterium]
MRTQLAGDGLNLRGHGRVVAPGGVFHPMACRAVARMCVRVLLGLGALLGLAACGPEALTGLGEGGASLLEQAYERASEAQSDPDRGERAPRTVASRRSRPKASKSAPMPPELRASYIASVQRDAQSEYELEASGTRVTGSCPAQGLELALGEGRLRISRARASSADGSSADGGAPVGSFSLELRWTGVGRPGAMAAVPAPTGRAQITANRVAVLRGHGLEEWYVSGPLGIEQGFVLSEPPRPRPAAEAAEARQAPLLIELSVEGLDPVLARDGRSVSLRTREGEPVLRYTDLFARDATGRSLDAHMDVAPAASLEPRAFGQQGVIELVVDDRDARYPLTMDPLVWAEVKRLTTSDAANGDYFGYSVAISADTAIVGAHGEDSAESYRGAAYVFGLRSTDGDACTADEQCASRHCIDDVCCDAPCAGTCKACSAAKTGGKDGVCALIPFGQDPDGECAGAEQSCDGAGACKKADGQGCGGASDCLSGHCIDDVCCKSACAGTCEACSKAKTGGTDGVCAPVPPAEDPDSECGIATEQSCDGARACKIVDGQPCAGAGDCLSGYCANGVCCNEPCDGECEACSAVAKATGEDGVCGPVAAGADPVDECEPDPGYPGSCGADGSCDGAGQCRQHAPAGVVCRAASCAGAYFEAEGKCDGAGQCEAGVTASCAPFVCTGAGNCRTSCRSTADCAGGYMCTSRGQCVEPAAAVAEPGCGCRLAPGLQRRHAGGEAPRGSALGLLLAAALGLARRKPGARRAGHRRSAGPSR